MAGCTLFSPVYFGRSVLLFSPPNTPLGPVLFSRAMFFFQVVVPDAGEEGMRFLVVDLFLLLLSLWLVCGVVDMWRILVGLRWAGLALTVVFRLGWVRLG